MKIALIGLGEVGGIIAATLAPPALIASFDLQHASPDSAPTATARRLGVHISASHEEAIEEADIIISAVTAAQTKAAAETSATNIADGAWYFDLNSASPNAKTESAKLINAAGGRYVEAAVMSPFPPKGCAGPIILGGPYAKRFAPIADSLGFRGVSVFSEEYGRASAAKLCRSVIVKGVEALLLEALLCARHYAVEDAVVASLSDLFPGCEWSRLSHYMITRSIEHGARRAEEMREAAITVSGTGIRPLLANATAARQEWAASLRPALGEEDLSRLLDRVAAAAGEKRQ